MYRILESLYCTPETKMTMYLNYPEMKKKLIKRCLRAVIIEGPTFPQDLPGAVLSLPGSGIPWREITSSRPRSLEGNGSDVVSPGNGEGPEEFIPHFLRIVESHEVG